jgi:tight adherence protein B
MDLSFVLFAVVAFLAVVLTCEGLYNLWASHNSAEAKRIAARLAALSGEMHTQASIERNVASSRLPHLNEMLGRAAAGQKLQRFVSASAMAVSPVELILMSGALGALGLLLPFLLGKPPIFGAALGLGLAVLPWWRVAKRRSLRIERIERQFPEALDLMGRAMRAGHAFPTAVKMVGDEMAEPLGRDFRLLFDEMNYGVPINDALANLARRVPLADVSYFVVAVMIQRESGGNLAELLDKMREHRAPAPQAARRDPHAVGRGAAVGRDPDRAALRRGAGGEPGEPEVHGGVVDRPGRLACGRLRAVHDDGGHLVDAPDHPHSGVRRKRA